MFIGRSTRKNAARWVGHKIVARGVFRQCLSNAKETWGFWCDWLSPDKEDFPSAFSPSWCPIPGYRQTLTFVYEEQEPNRWGPRPFRAPSPGVSLSWRLSGHSRLCPCLKPSGRLVSLKRWLWCHPSSLNRCSIRSTHYTNTHPHEDAIESVPVPMAQLYSQKGELFSSYNRKMPFFIFHSFLFSIDMDVWTAQRAKSRRDSPSSWVASNPSGIKALAISQRGPFIRLFCLPDRPFRPKALRVIDNETKIGPSQKSLDFLLWWRFGGPKSLPIPRLSHSKAPILPTEQDGRGTAPEGHT